MLGEKLKKLRKEKNISQQELAEKLFVSNKTISSWEQNRTEPNLDIIVSICNIFDISVSALIYDNINRTNIETEIKIKLEENEYKKLKKFFTKNAKFLKETHQVDTYYQPTYRKFIPENINDIINEWLRIGKRGNKIGKGFGGNGTGSGKGRDFQPHGSGFPLCRPGDRVGVSRPFG